MAGVRLLLGDGKSPSDRTILSLCPTNTKEDDLKSFGIIVLAGFYNQGGTEPRSDK